MPMHTTLTGVRHWYIEPLQFSAWTAPSSQSQRHYNTSDYRHVAMTAEWQTSKTEISDRKTYLLAYYIVIQTISYFMLLFL